MATTTTTTTTTTPAPLRLIALSMEVDHMLTPVAVVADPRSLPDLLKVAHGVAARAGLPPDAAFHTDAEVAAWAVDAAQSGVLELYDSLLMRFSKVSLVDAPVHAALVLAPTAAVAESPLSRAAATLAKRAAAISDAHARRLERDFHLDAPKR